MAFNLGACATPTSAPAASSSTAASQDGEGAVSSSSHGVDAGRDAADDDDRAALIASYRQSKEVEVRGAAKAVLTIGAAVDFTDDVKALSHKNTGDRGVYLSFGAPYPDQILSVWIPSAVWNQIPNRDLLEREVQVKGVVQRRSTGPTIEIHDAGQITLIPVDESILAADRISQSTMGDVAKALRQVLDRGSPKDIDTLQSVFHLLDTGKKAPPHSRTGPVFAALSLGTRDDEALFIRRYAQLEAWRERHPDSVGPVMALAQLEVDRAWAIRGDGSSSNRPRFLKGIERAAALLTPVDAVYVHAAGLELWQRIAQAQDWPNDRADELFRRAVRTFPDHIPFYVNAAVRRFVAWGGEPGEWEDFVEEQRSLRGGVDGAKLYAHIAWAMDREHAPHRIFSHTRLRWETIARGLEAIIADEPTPYWHSVYAHLAFEARDRRRLGPALDAVGRNADMSVWINLANFAAARRYADERPEVYEGKRIRIKDLNDVDYADIDYVDDTDIDDPGGAN